MYITHDVYLQISKSNDKSNVKNSYYQSYPIFAQIFNENITPICLLR